MGERRPLDAYYTPDPLARAIVRWAAGRIPAPRRIVEPSVGGGAFVRACREEWPRARVHGVDLDPDAVGLDLCDTQQIGDYLLTPAGSTFDLAVGNPPFGGPADRAPTKSLTRSTWQRHVEHAYLTAESTVMLLRLAALESVSRAEWWRTFTPAEVAVLSRRPSFTGRGTDSCAYGVFLWDGAPKQTVMSWLEWEP